MKIAALLTTLIGSTVAAPALVWKRGQESAPVSHSSEPIQASSLIASTVKSLPSDDSSLAAVFFLVGRDEHGNEALSQLTSSGALPNIASKYEAAESIHHHIDGMESPFTVARDARMGLDAKNNDGRVLEVNLDEFNRKLSSFKDSDNIIEEAEVSVDGQMLPKARKNERKRSRALKNADVLVVHVDSKSDHSALDSAVASAVDSENVGNVVLAGIRSVEEIKRERSLSARRRVSMMSKNSRYTQSNRRLEDANQDDQADEDADYETYYVNMTPNILSGILFTLFFVYVAWTGISCMGMIQGQDVYVNKMPSIGREA